MCTKGDCSYETNVRLLDGRQLRVPSICPEVAKELIRITFEDKSGSTAEGYDKSGRYVLFKWNEVREVLSV